MWNMLSSKNDAKKILIKFHTFHMFNETFNMIVEVTHLWLEFFSPIFYFNLLLTGNYNFLYFLFKSSLKIWLD